MRSVFSRSVLKTGGDIVMKQILKLVLLTMVTLVGCASQEPSVPGGSYIALSQLYARTCVQISDDISTLRKIAQDKGCGERSDQAAIKISTTPKYASPDQAIPVSMAMPSPAQAKAEIGKPIEPVEVMSQQTQNQSKPLTLDEAVNKCAALGVPRDTERFGSCVLSLSK